MIALNKRHVSDKYFIHCSEVVPSSEVEMYGQYIGRGEQCVHCREVVHSSECPLSEVPLFNSCRLIPYQRFHFLTLAD